MLGALSRERKRVAPTARRGNRLAEVDHELDASTRPDFRKADDGGMLDGFPPGDDPGAGIYTPSSGVLGNQIRYRVHNRNRSAFPRSCLTGF